MVLLPAVFPPSFPVTILVFIPTGNRGGLVHVGTAFTIGLDSELHPET